MHYESSIIIVFIIIIIIFRKSHNGHKENYMYKFYAVQRWSSYAYSAVNLKVGEVYLMLCYLQFVQSVETFFVYECVWVCVWLIWRHFSVYTVRKNCLSCSWVLSLSLCRYHLYNNKSVWNLLCKMIGVMCLPERVGVRISKGEASQVIHFRGGTRLLRWIYFKYLFILCW